MCNEKSGPFFQKTHSAQSSNFAVYDRAASNINFTSVLPRKLITKLPPIADKAEYDEIIKRILNSKTILGERFWSFKEDEAIYKNIKDEYIGLLPYCGCNDVSFYINGYLGNRLDKCGVYIPSEKTACDFVRALDYSLKQLDKEFGTFSGFVFRGGYFTLKPGQFASASESPAIGAAFHGYDPKTQYSIIKVKDAHKIHDFQKAMNSSYANEEKEILLDRNMKRRFVPKEEYSMEIIKLKEAFARNLCHEAKLYYAYTRPPKVLTYENALNKIKVYEQI